MHRRKCKSGVVTIGTLRQSGKGLIRPERVEIYFETNPGFRLQPGSNENIDIIRKYSRQLKALVLKHFTTFTLHFRLESELPQAT